MNEQLQEYFDKIESMHHFIGESKTNRIKAFVRTACEQNKTDKINLSSLAKMSRKQISLERQKL